MIGMHPHLKEEMELQEWHALGAGHHDRAEVEICARWDNNWKDEYILSDRDVWYSNPCYSGPEGMHPEYDYREENEEDQASEDKYLAELAAYWEEMSLFEIHHEEAEYRYAQIGDRK